MSTLNLLSQSRGPWLLTLSDAPRMSHRAQNTSDYKIQRATASRSSERLLPSSGRKWFSTQLGSWATHNVADIDNLLRLYLIYTILRLWNELIEVIRSRSSLTRGAARAGLSKIRDGSSRHSLLHTGARGSSSCCWFCQGVITVGSFQLQIHLPLIAIKMVQTGIGDHHILPCWGGGQRTACWRIWRFSWLWRWWKKKTRSSSAWTAPEILAWAAPPWWRPFSSWLHVRKLEEEKSRKSFKWEQNTNSIMRVWVC